MPEQVEVNEAFQPVVEKLEGWGDTLIAMLPNLVVAIVVLVLFWLIGRLARNLVQKALRRAGTRNAVIRLVGSVTVMALITIGLFIALGVLKLDRTVTSLLAGAGVIGLAIGFAFQNLAANFLAGTMISIRRTYREGDVIETQSHFGTVREITLRTTRLLTPQGQMVLVPNKDAFETPLINYSATGERRVDVAVGVSYGDDLDKAAEVALEAVGEIEGLVEDREPELFFEEFGSSSINFVVRFWVPFRRQTDYLAPRSEAIRRIKRAFDDNDLTIPFPIRTLDFGIHGGMNVTDALRPLTGGEGDDGEKGTTSG